MDRFRGFARRRKRIRYDWRVRKVEEKEKASEKRKKKKNGC